MQKLSASLSLDTLVPSLHRLMQRSPLINTPEPTVQLEKFLHFTIQGGLELLLPLTAIAEVQKLTLFDVLPVPQMPTWVVGLHHRQGEALWIIDFGHLLGFPLNFQAGHLFMTSMLIVMEVEDQRLGLAVPQVYDIELHDPQRFNTPMPTLISPQLARIYAGYEPKSGVILLNPNQITQTETLVPIPHLTQPTPT